MIAKLGRTLNTVFSKTAPDPFVLAILLTLVAGTCSVVFGFREIDGFADRSIALLDTLQGGGGLWKLLAFGMQMCLILVTGHALAASRPMRVLIRMLADFPGSAAGGASIVSLVAVLLGLVNWGLGLIAGALFAREVARVLASKGVRAHGALLAAAGYAGLLVWHGGLSGSAPLKMTSANEAAGVLPESVVAAMNGEGIPLSATIFSPMNLFVTGGLVVIVPVVFLLLTPKSEAEIVPMPVESRDEEPTTEPVRTLPEFLDRSPFAAWILAAILGAVFWRFAVKDGMLSLGPNEVNTFMLALGLVMHGSVRSYLGAAEEGARGCAGIILQFPLYAGIMAMLVGSGLIGSFTSWIGTHATETTAPVLTFLSAGLVNLFVPSGGGQWAVQGPIAMETASKVGVDPAKMVMAVAYGDQLTNMLQPFWALPLLAITKVKAREIIGYTAVVMLIAAVWMMLGLLVF